MTGGASAPSPFLQLLKDGQAVDVGHVEVEQDRRVGIESRRHHLVVRGGQPDLAAYLFEAAVS